MIESLKIQAETGIIPPKYILGMVERQMLDYLSTRSADPDAVVPESLSVYTEFRRKIKTIYSLNSEEQQEYLDAVSSEISKSFIPAYVDLVNQVSDLYNMATDDLGVWKFPNGDAYYAYILRNQTTTEMTPQEIHDLGLAEVTRIQTEMRSVFDELGYSQGESLEESINRAIADGGYYPTSTQAEKDQLIEAYEEIIDDVEGKLDAVFDVRPLSPVVVIGEPSFGAGGYYESPAADGSRPGAFHTGVGASQVAKFNMPTIAFHEAVPGHHFQIAIAQEADLPTFRNDIIFNAYVEGWAMYAERLAWELGVYIDDPHGDIGRLRLELLRAVRLVVDTGIHAMGWTREEAKAYMREALGDSSNRWSHEVERYTVLPGQATSYKIGMLKILELRQLAMEQLGDRFDIKEFHNVVLTNGSIPLDVLSRVVNDFIETKINP
jgi:uncharacterized protein (DUF885 family)